ncbi:Protein NIM1-INTERACTING 1 [Hirschfeldia incana]|nr:Protein NIM1-INTERACTING 1 [Hirschfeldia incana]
MKNKEDQNVEIKETKMIDKREREEEEEAEEEKKIDTFFKLIKTYQEARKRRREEFSGNSGQARKKWNGGERSCLVVPPFLPEDFSECRMDLKPVMVVSEQKEDDIKVQEVEEVEKDGQEEKGLDLNLAL